MRRRAGLLAILLIAAALIMAACGQGQVTSAPTSTSAAGPTTAATSEPSTPASAEPSAAEATPAESEPEAPAPGAMSVTDFTGPELFLLSGVRDDLVGGCRPVTELPEGADAGIECEGVGPIDEIGYYRFPDNETANRTYFARLAEHGVTQDSGDCRAGEPGELMDIPGDIGWAQRVGCYIDDAGAAAFRVIVPGEPDQSVYIGVAGTSDDIGAVSDWLNHSEPGSVGCAYCIDLWEFPHPEG
jgi:hypothetical protein